jgi:hypothetical protein
MAGLVPAIHVFCHRKKGVDARDKPAHDSDYFFGGMRSAAGGRNLSV